MYLLAHCLEANGDVTSKPETKRLGVFNVHGPRNMLGRQQTAFLYMTAIWFLCSTEMDGNRPQTVKQFEVFNVKVKKDKGSLEETLGIRMRIGNGSG